MTTGMLLTIIVVAVLLGLFFLGVQQVVGCRVALDDAQDDVASLRWENDRMRREIALLRLDLQHERAERREVQLVLFEVLEERGVTIRRVPLATTGTLN